MADSVDWNAVAADVLANFAATGQWFLHETGGPGPAIILASASATGVPGDNSSFNPALSADGSKVAFESNASNLVVGGTNGTTDIYVKDLATGSVTLVSTAASGAEANGESGGGLVVR